MINAKRAKDAMILHGIKNIDVAKEIGISTVDVSRFICGKRNPSNEVLEKIANMLHVTSDYLVEPDGESSAVIAFDRVMHYVKTYGSEWTRAEKKQIITALK